LRDLEQKFYDHFFSGDYELDLVDLAALRQGKDESVNDYIRRFRDTRNRCFQINLAEKELVELAFHGMRYYLKERLESIQFFTLARLHQKALACDSRCKDIAKAVRHNVHIVDCDQNSSDDEPQDMYAAEMVWPKQAKAPVCSSLQPIQKKRQEEVKFTFNVSKCDKIFDELLKSGNIKLNHTMPSVDELKRRAYCKWHNSFSHANNDCNVFRRQVQSAINEGRLKFQKMQVDTEPFSMNMINFDDKKVLVRPSAADKGKGKEIIISDPREADENTKISCRKVVAEKTPDGGETLKITIAASNVGGQAQTGSQARPPVLRIADGPAHRRGRSGTPPDGPGGSGGQSSNAQGQRRPRTFKLRRPKIGTWKTNTFKASGRLVKAGPTFDQLLSKYVQKAGPKDRPAKRPRSPAQDGQARSIRFSHQAGPNKSAQDIAQLTPPPPTSWTPPPPYPYMSYHYAYPPPPYVQNQMWGMPPYPYGMPQYPAWGAPQTSVFDRLAPPLQDRLGSPQSGHQARVLQDCRTTRQQRPTNPAGGHREEMSTGTKRTTKGDIIKIGTADVVIQGNNEGPMVFGKLAKTEVVRDTGATSKASDLKYSMPRWCPSGQTRS
jgi:hypothetical protein